MLVVIFPKTSWLLCAVEGYIDRDRYGGIGKGNVGNGVGVGVTEGLGVCVEYKRGDGVGVEEVEGDEYGVGVGFCNLSLVFKVDGIAYTLNTTRTANTITARHRTAKTFCLLTETSA